MEITDGAGAGAGARAIDAGVVAVCEYLSSYGFVVGRWHDRLLVNKPGHDPYLLYAWADISYGPIKMTLIREADHTRFRVFPKEYDKMVDGINEPIVFVEWCGGEIIVHRFHLGQWLVSSIGYGKGDVVRC